MGNLRIGLFGARACNSGLGTQTWEFFRHVKPAKTLIMDISNLNGNVNFFERYTNNWNGDVRIYQTPPSPIELVPTALIEEWLKDLDVVVCFEIPYNYELFRIARERGIKTVLQYNYEFLDYTNQSLPVPDLFAAPSEWHIEEVKERFSNTRYWPVPVNREVIPFRPVSQAKTFVHVAGVKLFEDRNGTEIVLNAIHYVKSEAKFIIYTQHDLGNEKIANDPRVEIRALNVPNYWEVYKEGDVLLLPRRFGGLTLQLNEAMSSGMIPVMTDVSPQNRFLTPYNLIAPDCKKVVRTRGADIDCYDVNPMRLAEKIDQMFNERTSRIRFQSTLAGAYAASISWNKMLPFYMEELEKVKNGN